MKIISNIEGTRFGNHLYFFLYAYKNKNIKVRYLKNMDYWFEYFPKLEELIEKDYLNYKEITIPKNFFQEYKQDFLEEDLKKFITEYLLNESKLFKNPKEDLVINVRRGDFYDEKHRELYGFEQKDYLKKAIKRVNLTEVKRISIVSDDIAWCKKNIDFFDNKKEIIYHETNPIDNFLVLCNAKNLVIMNSTFSYWGGYVNKIINPNCKIIAPNFNTLLINKGKMISSLDSWELVDVKTYYTRKTIKRMNRDKVKDNIRVFLRSISRKIVLRFR